MNEDRLNEIEALMSRFEWEASVPQAVRELVAEVRRLRDGITGLADEWERAASLFDKRYGKQSRRSIVSSHVKRLRAALAEGSDHD